MLFFRPWFLETYQEKATDLVVVIDASLQSNEDVRITAKNLLATLNPNDKVIYCKQ